MGGITELARSLQPLILSAQPVEGDALIVQTNALGGIGRLTLGPLATTALPTPTAGISTFLREDGTWAAPDVKIYVKNTSGATIDPGDPVYATGSVGASGAIEVGQASASDPASMPAIGVAAAAIEHNDFGYVVANGVVRNLDTSAWSINQTVYVDPAKGLTGTRPTSSAELVQNIGHVVRVHATTGEVLVSCVGRSNDTPNYATAKLLGRNATTAGPAEAITIGTGLALSGTTLTTSGINNDDWTGDPLALANGGTGSTDAPTARTAMAAAQQQSEQFVEIFDDFFFIAQWNNATNGTGTSYVASDHVNSTEKAAGVLALNTGTGGAGARVSRYDGNDSLLVGNGFSWDISIRASVSALSTASEEYTICFGLQDNNTASGEPTDGLYFWYDRATHGDLWMCCSSNAGTRTRTSSGVAPSAYSPLKVFRVAFDAATTTATFYIDGSLVATITTNIPTGATGIGMKLEKTAGTSARYAYFDYIHLKGSRTSAR